MAPNQPVATRRSAVASTRSESVEAVTPGHLVRRAQQVHTALWSERLHGELTGPQYAALIALSHEPGLDQTRLSEVASLDKNTAGDIIRRLVLQGWVHRTADPKDRRRRLLQLTSAARLALRFVTPAAALVQADLLEPVPALERSSTTSALAKLAFARGWIPVERPERDPPVLSMTRSPGYLIRRVQQVHSALWAELVGPVVTEPQYAVLTVLSRRPGIDQASAGRLASLDRSSTADVVARLSTAGWLQRQAHAQDARRVSLSLPAATANLLARVEPVVARVHAELLQPLAGEDVDSLLRNLTRIAFHDDQLTAAVP